MNMDTQNRLKSKVVWVSIVSAVIILAGEWGLYNKLGIEKELIQKTIDCFFLILTSFGILNNPTSKGDF